MFSFFSLHYLVVVFIRNSVNKLRFQWRANCSQSQGLGSDELGKANWGWSWKERWIAARPWESRVAPQQFISPKKIQSKQANKVSKTPKTPISVKTNSPNVKVSTKARRLSFPSSEKLVGNEESNKVEETTIKKEELVS